MSQQHVADELGLARPAISQMEAGQRGVNSIELARLSRLYRRPLEYFLRPLDEVESVSLPLDLRVVFRAEPALLESGDVGSVLDDILRRAGDYAEVERLLDRQRPLVAADYRAALAALRKLPWQEGAWVADQERCRFQVGDGPILDLFGLIERVGVKVIFADLPEDVSGGFFSTEETGPCIFLNRRHSLLRVRFTCAHEFAHVLFDRDDQRSIVDRAVPVARGNAAEQRANAFAAAFLMPEVGVRRFLDDLGIEPRLPTGLALLALSEHFGTSYPATLFRLQNLGVIDRERRLELEQERPTTIRSPNGTLLLTPVAEVPHWSARFVTLALLAYDRGLVSLGRLTELLNADRTTVVALLRSQGIEPRLGPADREEALAEVDALRRPDHG